MTDALIYLVDSLLTIYLYVLILRFVMQLSARGLPQPDSRTSW